MWYFVSWFESILDISYLEFTVRLFKIQVGVASRRQYMTQPKFSKSLDSQMRCSVDVFTWTKNIKYLRIWEKVFIVINLSLNNVINKLCISVFFLWQFPVIVFWNSKCCRFQIPKGETFFQNTPLAPKERGQDLRAWVIFWGW